MEPPTPTPIPSCVDEQQSNTMSTTTTAPTRNHKIFNKEEVQQMINDGRKVVIKEGLVLCLDKWAHRHPGGELVIMHMLGRDATDEINVYHSAETLKRMGCFAIGRIDGSKPWDSILPPIQQSPGVPVQQVIEERRIVAEKDIVQAIEKAAAETQLLPSACITTCSQSPSKDCRSRVSTPAVAEKAPVIPGPVSTILCDLDARTTSREDFTRMAEKHEINIDLAKLPSLESATQQFIMTRYRALHEKIKAQDLYECHYINYFKECCRYGLLFAGFIYALRAEWFMTSAVFLGLFWHQIMFTAHDAGHLAISHNFVIDSLIGIFIADFCCGLSLGWWKSSHNVHHLVPNHPEHDPDIQNAPLLATSPSFFRSIKSTYYGGFIFFWDKAADILVPIQKYNYYPIMAIARFNLYLLSWIHLMRKNTSSLGKARWTRPTEILFMACYWYWFGYQLLWCCLPSWPMRIMFVLVSHMVTFPLHIQITLSHFAMSTADLGPNESFAQKQLRTTMDVDCPAWLDWIHGGLQFQAVHHLFPRVPRHNLRQVQSLVKVFCQETGLEYKCLGFVDGNREVIGRLGEIGRQVEFLRRCEGYVRENKVLHEVY